MARRAAKNHRLPEASSTRSVELSRPFSNFDFVDDCFNGSASIRRVFSQARSYGARTLVLEEIPPVGIIADENEEIARRYSTYSMGGLQRLTFWKHAIADPQNLAEHDPASLLGYALLKRDQIPEQAVDRWHVFESVLVKYPHHHNCIHGAKSFVVRAGNGEFKVEGVMYCQQNQLNKACAQVALRSLCSMHVDDLTLPFSRINGLAARGSGLLNPAEGLDAQHIQAVLAGLDIGFTDVDYTQLDEADTRQLPYQKFLYAGVESGAGALLGFQLMGPDAEGRHIIPFFGHTFNQDAWVPNAEAAYFHVGENTRYIPSEAWMSSFIGHDDNFGSNFCVPRLYVTPEQAQYVVALQPTGVNYSGVVAEAIAVGYLYSLLPELNPAETPWLRRLIQFASDQKVVLRAVALSRTEYAQHLRDVRDWNDNPESEQVCQSIEDQAPEKLWVVEVSLPELFPANQRKLGEIVLDATCEVSTDSGDGAAETSSGPDFDTYLFARFPGRFVVLKQVLQDGSPTFSSIPSGLKSHVPVYVGE